MKRNISDIKDHMKTEHKNKSAWIRVCQSVRKISEYFDTKDYQTRELFSKQFNKWLDSTDDCQKETVMSISVPCSGSYLFLYIK